MKFVWKKINFTEEIIEYRQSLYTEAARQVFDEIFASLNKEGRNAKWFYFSLSNLGNRNIVQCRKLFSYQPFIEEVDIAAAEYDAGREQQALAILREDKANFEYQNAMFPSLAKKEYKVGIQAAYKLRELYGEEPVPQKFMAADGNV